jgi:hypothetical protein
VSEAPPLVRELLALLPAEGEPFPAAERARWLTAAGACLALLWPAGHPPAAAQDDLVMDELLKDTGGDEQLAEALAALHAIAEAQGQFTETWEAQSISEVGDMLAAWCRRRRDQ